MYERLPDILLSFALAQTDILVYPSAHATVCKDQCLALDGRGQTETLRAVWCITGAADAPPIVLLHGWAQDHRLFRHLAPLLAQTHRVLCVNFRGHDGRLTDNGDFTAEDAENAEFYILFAPSAASAVNILNSES